jgi:hypothetical protein
MVKAPPISSCVVHRLPFSSRIAAIWLTFWRCLAHAWRKLVLQYPYLNKFLFAPCCHRISSISNKWSISFCGHFMHSKLPRCSFLWNWLRPCVRVFKVIFTLPYFWKLQSDKALLQLSSFCFAPNRVVSPSATLSPQAELIIDAHSTSVFQHASNLKDLFSLWILAEGTDRTHRGLWSEVLITRTLTSTSGNLLHHPAVVRARSNLSFTNLANPCLLLQVNLDPL